MVILASLTTFFLVLLLLLVFGELSLASGTGGAASDSQAEQASAQASARG